MWSLISMFIGIFILVFTCVFFGRFIIKNEFCISLLRIFGIVFLCSLSLFLICFLNISYLKTILSFICYYSIFRYVFKIYGIKNFMVTLIYLVVLFCSDILFFFLMTLIMKLDGKELYLIFGGTIISNISVSFICFSFGLLLKKFIIKLLNINVKNSNVIYWIIVFVLLSLFFVVSFTNATFSIETYVVLAMVLIILIILLISFYQAYKNNKLEIKYDKLLEFIKKYEIEIDKQRTMRHETKNQLLMIKSKLIDKDNESNVIYYIDEIIKDNNHKINHSEYAKLRYLPSNGLKGLFYFKVDEAIDKKIKVDINISKNVENSFLFKLNSNTFNQLGKILGIFLDNAIEASSLSKDKVLGIECYLNKDEVNFIISNSYLSINDKLRSTKGINRGHGLILAKTIINSNSKFNNSTEINNNLFIQKLSIKK